MVPNTFLILSLKNEFVKRPKTSKEPAFAVHSSEYSRQAILLSSISESYTTHCCSGPRCLSDYRSGPSSPYGLSRRAGQGGRSTGTGACDGGVAPRRRTPLSRDLRDLSRGRERVNARCCVRHSPRVNGVCSQQLVQGDDGSFLIVMTTAWNDDGSLQIDAPSWRPVTAGRVKAQRRALNSLSFAKFVDNESPPPPSCCLRCDNGVRYKTCGMWQLQMTWKLASTITTVISMQCFATPGQFRHRLGGSLIGQMGYYCKSIREAFFAISHREFGSHIRRGEEGEMKAETVDLNSVYKRRALQSNVVTPVEKLWCHFWKSFKCVRVIESRIMCIVRYEQREL